MAADTEIEGALAVNETPRALCVELSDGKQVWVPRSVIVKASQVKDCTPSGRGPGTLVVKTWYARKEGLCGMDL